ncbi:MAG: type IV pilus secretin PilQ [Desulfotignum sp.]|nr:type IV pilus secretin PilQ [Desulfotignum sp.]MCF8112463.1 type IV pilus secretin PilQ [Desulfotignum sp.]MCF8124838.1 type IV pilus secretin PilQ [Desulfotignum sp.]
MGNNMVFFQFYTTIYRVLAGVLILAVLLGSGCTFLKTEKPESSDIPAQEDIPAGVNWIHAIDVQSSDKQVDIRIKAKDRLAYTSIKQDFPFGIAIYLPDARIDPDLKSAAAVSPVETIKTGYADKEQTTAKIEILLHQDLPYEVKEQGNDLQISLLKPRPAISQAVIEESPSQPSLVSSAKDQDKPTSPEIVVPETGAVMTGVEFNTSESGHADIRVKTTRPVRYETVWQTDSQLNLILHNTRIPAHHQRPLLTKYFKAAVDQILPRSGEDGTNDAKIEIMIREKVPFRVVQDQSLISLRFDPASVDPPLFEKAVNPVMVHPAWAGDMPENERAPDVAAASSGIVQAAHPVKSQWGAVADQEQTRYSGEKIKLDFYDTDIKNVFRILRSVSGLNFAVDKDVQGKVTMTLEKPVPWDQVLDLVLKMNGLGKKMEGDVVRIATIQTLKQEEQDLQDAIAARKKALDQKKSLEPLVTEYIPINYSDAQADIQPHITSLLTPERGSISVDQRSNMVIVTDTKEKVDQIQEMIFRLDTVTPQIMIEAKVVEVTREFSRNIGVGWNLSTDAAVSSGFVNDMNVSVNNPIGDGGVSGDFSFFRLFGSSRLALNAKLAASEAQGDVRIVSSPRILTLDNKKARIKQGMEYAYLERDDAGGSSVQFKDIDLLLEVTPHVTPDERISMRVFLTKNDIAGITPSGAPTLATNETETELLVNNNDTVVIGGIVKTTTNRDKTGLPFLTGIPILGNMLLGSTLKEDTRNELLIFLTPSIVQLEQKRNPSRSPD